MEIGFGSKKLLSINAEIHSGKLTALIGRNGVGKSTLLKTIAGLTPPLSGSVKWNDLALEKLLPSQMATVCSIVFTQRPPVQGLTVYAVLELGRFPHHKKEKNTEKDQTIIAHFAASMQIEHLLERAIETLSDGEMQKVMIARAFIQETPIILLDEPTAFLDYIAKEEVIALLKENAIIEDKIVLFSSHDMGLIEKFAHARLGLG
ncbi:MAG: ABC transporter ATP-binding protein [Flavobacteriales bacterium]